MKITKEMSKSDIVNELSKKNLKTEKARKKPILIDVCQINEDFEVDTLEGKMKGKAGDWLMVGVNGEMYPCANDVFQKTYDVQL